MYLQKQYSFKGIKGIKTMQGETIEQKMRRIINNKEPVKDGAPPLYTERKDGVRAEYDIRTDKWEIAAGAMDKVHQVNAEKRRQRSMGDQAKENMEKEQKSESTGGKNDGTAESTEATK